MATATSLPFFPLGMIAFPGEEIRLHIFEPRYRQLFGELSEAGGTFVICPSIDGRLRALGTEVAFQTVDRSYGSGEMDISGTALGAVKVLSFTDPLPGKLYAGGEVERLDYVLEPGTAGKAELLLERCKDLQMILGAHGVLPPAQSPGFSFAVGHRLGLTQQQEYRLLTLATEDERQDYLLKLAERSIKLAERTLKMKRAIQMNGHFRYISAEPEH